MFSGLRNILISVLTILPCVKDNKQIQLNVEKERIK